LKPKPEPAADVRRVAMDLLARREHSVLELTRKLQARGFEPQLVDAALQQLVADGLLSDARFAETFVYSRLQRGSGPAKIRAELRERGVADSNVEQVMAGHEDDWLQLLRAVRDRKFGPEAPGDYRERARQMRFLQGRGFTSEQIGRLFRDDD
jgi:regulatory protein